MTQGQGYFELVDPETGKAPEHQKNALKGKGNDVSNAEVVPATKTSQLYGNEYHAEPVSLEVLMKDTKGVIVGGYVRDMVMGIEPHDLDLASPMLPEDVLRRYKHSFEMGFGTVAVKTTDFGIVEITTFRKESGGRHPEKVKFTSSLKVDMGRRDFTINALALDKEGDIIDFYGGIEDIEDKVIRTIYDPYETLDIDTGDPLRTIRAVRFEHKLEGFSIEPTLQDAIRNADLSTLSGERIYMELEKMFEVDAASAIEYLDHYGILEKILPEVHVMKMCCHNPEHHPEGDCFQHTLRTLEFVQDEDMVTKMAALLHDVGKPKVMCVGSTTYHGHDKAGMYPGKAIMKRLGRPKVEQDAVSFVIKNHMKMHKLSEMKPSKRRALYDSPFFPILLKVTMADGSMRGFIDPYEIQRYVESDEPTRKRPAKPLIDGNVIMSYGIPPGPLISEIQKDIVEQQIEGNITTEQEALEYFVRKYVV